MGPSWQVLEKVGEKTAARRVAEKLGIPVLRGSRSATDADGVRAFLQTLPRGADAIVKAVNGGGGRGIARVRIDSDIDAAVARCIAEAQASFGSGQVFVEEYWPGASHVEVQLVGDGTGAVAQLLDRDCSVQRRWQKLIEIGPAVTIEDVTRKQLADYAGRIGRELSYRGLATVEFLVRGSEIAFLEINPRIQVEHTVTEEVTGLDLVTLQLHTAAGRTLAELGIDPGRIASYPRLAVQARVNCEQIDDAGFPHASPGTISEFRPPTGRGVRVDTHAYVGMKVGVRYDSLLAKVIVSDADASLPDVFRALASALSEFHIRGVDTNTAFLQSILKHDEILGGRITTEFIERDLNQLLAESELLARKARPKDPQLQTKRDDGPSVDVPVGAELVVAPVSGVVVAVRATAGDAVEGTSVLITIESMKMQYDVRAAGALTVQTMLVEVGSELTDGDPICIVEIDAAEDRATESPAEQEAEGVRPELEDVLAAQFAVLDANRGEAVERRHRLHFKTARENIAALCDDFTFMETGALAVAAQRRRRTDSELAEQTPADGVIAGTARVAGVPCVVIAYDYTVLAGTQGVHANRKSLRMFDLAATARLPLVVFAEGGGGRPGETDFTGRTRLDEPNIQALARLRGLVPLIAIVNGRTFAASAMLAACCHLIIATRGSNLGMGGPAMVFAGGLGEPTPEQIGPADVHARIGTVDMLVATEAEAAERARQLVGYFMVRQAPVGQVADQSLLRTVVPRDRKRSYNVRRVIEILADQDTFVELKASYGRAIVTGFARIGGHAVGICANNPLNVGGAIDTEAAQKSASFIELCQRHGLPLIPLVDTPGFMVGPESERTGAVG
ncbi:MAG TPA: carboxyl transferase domain-containing protein, partial [Galbitalea sp.]|nr:carboxyl transferase domain-containing protein [Galbitalea sp.]